MYQTMRNMVRSETVYEFGKTYVSLAFVDISQLLFGKYKNYTDDKSAHLKYFCYDRCPVVIARGHIIWNLLKTPGIRPESIMQVWYSSCWDDQTLIDFRKACSITLKIMSTKGIHHQESTLRIIKHWINSSCTRDEALQKWHEASKDEYASKPLGNLIKKEDRIQYARYWLKGIIFVDKSRMTSGNISMFKMPLTNDGKMYDIYQENIFHSIDFYSTTANVLSQNPCNLVSLIYFVEKLFIFKLNKLTNLVQQGQIEVFIEQKDISADDDAFAAMIKAKNPCAIEWSNLPDFIGKEKFIRFARLCSGDKTAHSIDSTKWRQHVFGTSWYDYCGYSAKKEFPIYDYYEMRKELQKRVYENWESCSKSSAAAKFFRPTFLGLPRRVHDECLARLYLGKYLKYFFAYEDGSLMNMFFDLSQQKLFNPFSFCTYAFHIVISFNKEIRLSQNSKYDRDDYVY